MYSIEELKELISVLDKSSLTGFEMTCANGDALKLSREVKTISHSPVYEAITHISAETTNTASEDITNTDDFDVISSPMVGVFYEAPSPDSKPFVTVGQKVSKGETVCIIEAMKLMNEITAEKSGVIAEVCVDNGDIVEYGQPLFKIK